MGDFDPTVPVDFGGCGGSDAHERPLPYRTVEVVFNNKNCWANLQHSSPDRILWDLSDRMYWHPFAERKFYGKGLAPCFQGCKFPDGGRDGEWVAVQRRELLQALRAAVRAKRSHKNLDTRWLRISGLERFLGAGLRLRAKVDVARESEVARLREQYLLWERALKAKVPARHKSRAMTFHLNFYDPSAVSNHVLNLCMDSDPSFLECRQKSTQFDVAVHLSALPAAAVSLYVCVWQMHGLTDIEKDDELARRQSRLGGAAPPRPRALAPEPASMPQRPEVSEQPPASPERPRRGQLTGFDECLCGKFVRVSGDGGSPTAATYVGSKQDGSYHFHGGVIGNGPIPGSSEGKRILRCVSPASGRAMMMVWPLA
ncbi:unnamed protein product [Prorocentrum cordatum]|uniref:CEP76/DRC7 peptidase-like domain-containing protein n=1 Tax=Prorocentrum cordatum TaxID=2364126 RepID=A0ABN9SEJ8_9DINO|nr:unnamed protein product [Polarella glacialis]